MKRLYDPKIRIENLYSYLKHTDADEIVIRTTRVAGGWHDNESSAMSAGFSISRFRDPAMEARHEFSECYRLLRK